MEDDISTHCIDQGPLDVCKIHCAHFGKESRDASILHCIEVGEVINVEKSGDVALILCY